MKNVYTATRDLCAVAKFSFFRYGFSELRAQTSDGSVRDDGHRGAGRMGGLEADGTETAVVFDRRRSGSARVAQTHSAPLHPAAEALSDESDFPDLVLELADKLNSIFVSAPMRARVS